MRQPLNDKDRWLAAEYALGVLDGEGMALAERRYELEPLFREAVEEWQNQLSPMLEDIEPAPPPEAVWRKIAGRTTGTAEEAKINWLSSLAFWRAVSALTGSLAVASVAALLLLPGSGLLVTPKAGQPLVATLTQAGETPAFVARFNPATGALVVRAALNQPSETRTAELWLIPADGVPRSLGLLTKDGLGSLKVSDGNRQEFASGGTLAVSLEPDGGSPTGAPTGPVVASGKLQTL